jgi:hypothetical protein
MNRVNGIKPTLSFGNTHTPCTLSLVRLKFMKIGAKEEYPPVDPLVRTTLRAGDSVKIEVGTKTVLAELLGTPSTTITSKSDEPAWVNAGKQQHF